MTSNVRRGARDINTHTFRHVALASAVAILGVKAAAQQEAVNHMNAPFLSVLRQETYVFASNKAGLFRADLESRQWHKLDLPVGMPPGGKFGKVPKVSTTILYVVSDRHGRSGGKETFGIYASRDAGETWSLLSEHDDYGPVLLLPAGSLFAVTNPTSTRGPTQIHMSKDMGKTWRNISGKSGGIFDIFPDPDHPNQICLSVSVIREYILQADDERYLWNWTFGMIWRQERLSATEFFTRTYSYSFQAPPVLYATLDNYFQYDFGDRVKMFAIDLSPDEPRFNVSQGEKVVVPITFRFHDRAPATVKLIDGPSSSAHFGIHVEFQGQLFAKSAKAHDVFRAENRDAARQRMLSETTWTDVTLTKASPYRRRVDITQLHDFSAKGTYRVQLIYDNNWLTGRDSGHWLGRFSSSVFEVVVEDPKE